MIRYFFDTEFNGHGGELISAALVRDDGESLYLINPAFDVSPKLMTEAGRASVDPWVLKNVIPILWDIPPSLVPTVGSPSAWGHLISEFIYRGDEVPQIFADWMSDIADLMKLFITGPGTGVPMSHQTHMVCLRHLDVYPTTLPHAVQHNAWWDAMALRHWLEEMEAK